MQVKMFLSIMSIFIILIFHYLSNDVDTGTEYGNNGAAPTKKFDTKILFDIFDPPFPIINVYNIYWRNVDAASTLILQTTQSSQYLVCFGIQYTVWISKLATWTTKLHQCHFNYISATLIWGGGGLVKTVSRYISVQWNICNIDLGEGGLGARHIPLPLTKSI